MKKFFLFLLCLPIVLSGCTKINDNINSTSIGSNSELNKSFIFKDFKGNEIWAGAMNLAWSELSENIIKEKIQLDTEDEGALKTTELFNNSKFSKNDLDEEDYYIKSGYGQETINLINKESKEKFSDKSFSDLDFKIEQKDIISYAYFLKQVEYQVPFLESTLKFNDQVVNGFYAKTEDQRQNINILKYWNNDKFIIELNLKDSNDQIFLAKGFDNKNPSKVIELINENKNSETSLSENEIFKMPKLHIDQNYEYKEMINKFFANNDFKLYKITKMFESLKFDMDQNGAKVENEGVIASHYTSILDIEEPKREFVLDKSFLVIMKKDNRLNPYFILGVNNTEIMEK